MSSDIFAGEGDDANNVMCVVCARVLPLHGQQPDAVVDQHIEAGCPSPEPEPRSSAPSPPPFPLTARAAYSSTPMIQGHDGGWRVLPESLKPHGDWVMGVDFVANRQNLILTSSIQGDIALHD